MPHKPLDIFTLTQLARLADCVAAGQPITWLDTDGREHWGVTRAFGYDGEGSLGVNEDVRDAYVWISGGSSLAERWVPVAELVTGLAEGRVSLNYRGDGR